MKLQLTISAMFLWIAAATQAAAPSATQTNQDPNSFQTNVALQAQLERITKAKAVPQYLREIAAAIEITLGDESDPDDDMDEKEFIRQVMYHLAYGPAKPNEKKQLLGRMLLAEEVTKIPRQQVLNAVGIYLESDDPKLREAAESMLGAGAIWDLDYRAGQVPTFSAIVGYLDSPPNIQSLEQLPPAIVTGMFNTDPSAALATFSMMLSSPQDTTDELRQERIRLRDADHCLTHHRYAQNHVEVPRRLSQGAVDALNDLSKNEYWWARLYVATMMCRHRDLQLPEVIAVLAKDQNPLVRKCIDEIKRQNATVGEPGS